MSSNRDDELARQLRWHDQYIDQSLRFVYNTIQARREEIKRMGRARLIVGYEQYGAKSWGKLQDALEVDLLEELADAGEYGVMYLSQPERVKAKMAELRAAGAVKLG